MVLETSPWRGQRYRVVWSQLRAWVRRLPGIAAIGTREPPERPVPTKRGISGTGCGCSPADVAAASRDRYCAGVHVGPLYAPSTTARSYTGPRRRPPTILAGVPYGD